MTPQTKKIISTSAVTVGVAVLGALGHYVVKLPPEWQTAATAVISGALYVAKSWGTQQEIDEQVLTKVTAAVGKEVP